MSDFLSRLAARAVRDVPRVPSAVPEAAAAASRVEQAEVPVARATPTAAEVRAEAPDVRVEAERDPPRPEPVAAQEPSEPRTVAPTSFAQLAPPPTPVREPGDSVTKRVAVRVGDPVAVVAAMPIPAAPSIERRVESRLERVHTVETVAADEPPVRVHIGRLEVRANLEQPARQQPKRERERPQGQTLSDYLRGRRTA